MAAWQEVVGRLLDLGFDEFVFPEPDLEGCPVFESVVSSVIPDLGSGRSLSVVRQHRLLPDARVHIVPGASHAVDFDLPDELARVVEAAVNARLTLRAEPP